MFHVGEDTSTVINTLHFLLSSSIEHKEEEEEDRGRGFKEEEEEVGVEDKQQKGEGR